MSPQEFGGGVPAAIQVNFTPVTGRYVRLQALYGSPWTAAAEINVLGKVPNSPATQLQKTCGSP